MSNISSAKEKPAVAGGFRGEARAQPPDRFRFDRKIDPGCAPRCGSWPQASLAPRVLLHLRDKGHRRRAGSSRPVLSKEEQTVEQNHDDLLLRLEIADARFGPLKLTPFNNTNRGDPKCWISSKRTFPNMRPVPLMRQRPWRHPGRRFHAFHRGTLGDDDPGRHGAEIIKSKPRAAATISAAIRRCNPDLKHGAPFLWTNRNKPPRRDRSQVARRPTVVRRDDCQGRCGRRELLDRGHGAVGSRLRDLSEDQTEIIYCSVSAYGRDGRLRRPAGFRSDRAGRERVRLHETAMPTARACGRCRR